jgi:uroporphyrinogen-III synthase
MGSPSFEGLRVLSLESRRAREMAALITSHGGRPLVAPSMREVPLESNAEALASAEAIIRGEFDLLVLLTGVGTRALLDVVQHARGTTADLVAAMQRTKIAVRGPKPAAVLRGLQVPFWVSAPEPNTWRELLGVLDSLRAEFPLEGKRLALQEYGESNQELIAGLESRGARVTTVAVYRWALPEDLGPLQEAARALTGGDVDVALFTTATQVVHLLRIARDLGIEDAVRDRLRGIVVASIGPTTSEELREQGITADMEPSHPKMGLLVREAAERARELMGAKRTPPA